MRAPATTIALDRRPLATATPAAQRIAVIVFAVLSLIPCVAARAQDCLWPTWTQVADNPELARFEHAMAYDAARQQVVMFGGRQSHTILRGDTAIWDGAAWTPLAVPGPAPRARHSMAFDASRSRVVLAGGVDSGGARLRDTWEWDGASWMQVATQGPDLCGPAMAWDSVRGRIVAVDLEGAVWSWDGVDWLPLATGSVASFCSSSGFGAWGRAVAFDPARGVLVAASHSRTDEWSPKLGWQRTSEGAHPYWGIAGHSMFYSPVKGGVMVFGGNDTGGFGTNQRGGVFVLRDGIWCTWSFAAGATIGLPPRQDHATVELPGGGALTFGGRAFTAFGATLSLSFQPAPPLGFVLAGAPDMFGRSLPNHTVSIRQFAFDAWNSSGFVRDLGVAYRWRHNGVDLVDGPSPGGATISGSATMQVTLQGIGIEDFGMYHLAAQHCSGVTENIGSLVCPANLTTSAIPGTGYGKRDNGITSDDFFYFLTAYAAGNAGVADITSVGAVAAGHPGWLVPDGLITSDDFFAFVAFFQSGC